jgi:YfiH family protein
VRETGFQEFAPVVAGGLSVLRWPELDATGVVDAVVTTRPGGVSAGAYDSLNLGLHVGDDPAAVIENRRRAARAIGLELDDLVFGRQAHGRNVAVVGRTDRGRGTRSDDDAIADVDALVTADPDVGLVMMVADCVPIVLVDPQAGVLGAVHAGWRGTVARVGAAAVEAMVSLGARADRIVAGVGPSILFMRYQVGEEVAAAARDTFGHLADALVPPDVDHVGRFMFDLWSANLFVLRDAGVPERNIHIALAVTGSEHFFSDRAERPCGRFAALARLRP